MTVYCQYVTPYFIDDPLLKNIHKQLDINIAICGQKKTLRKQCSGVSFIGNCIQH